MAAPSEPACDHRGKGNMIVDIGGGTTDLQ